MLRRLFLFSATCAALTRKLAAQWNTQWTDGDPNERYWNSLPDNTKMTFVIALIGGVDYILKFISDMKKSDITPEFRALMDLAMPPSTDGFSAVVRRLDALYFENQNISIPIVETDPELIAP